MQFAIGYIIGSWKIGIEYGNLINSFPAKLTVLDGLIEVGSSPEQAALGTPTGKWVTAIGYDKVRVIRQEYE